MNLNLLDHIEDLDSYIQTLNASEKQTVLKYLIACENYKLTNKLKFFEPEEWQLKAIKLGATEDHRMVSAGNR